MLSELVRLDKGFENYHRYHLTIASKDLKLDNGIFKLIAKQWRYFCDLQFFKTLCFDGDGTAHLHIVLWSAEKFRPEFYPKFKGELLTLDGWKSPAVNGYSIVCLKPHNSAERLFRYITSEDNLRFDELTKSSCHFYTTSRGFDTEQLSRLFRRFRDFSASVHQSLEQLGILAAKLQDSEEKAESVKAFIHSLFSNSRDDGAHGRSKKESMPLHRSPRSRIPYTERKRDVYFFFKFEYLPETAHGLSIITAKLSSYCREFQARLIPKLIYDSYVDLWKRNTALLEPPSPLDDFYSDDFLCLAARDLSAFLPRNPP